MEYGNWYYGRYYKYGFRYILLKFRIDPIPRSGLGYGGKKNFYAYHRRPRTTQERRMSYDPVYTRSRRNKMNLITAYDDKIRSDCRTRKGWKKTKCKRQWMKKFKRS